MSIVHVGNRNDSVDDAVHDSGSGSDDNDDDEAAKQFPSLSLNVTGRRHTHTQEHTGLLLSWYEMK